MESNNQNIRWDPGLQANDKTDKNIQILPVKIRKNCYDSLLYLAKCHYILGFDLFLKCLLMFCCKSCTLQEYTCCMCKCRVSFFIFGNLCNNAPRYLYVLYILYSEFHKHLASSVLKGVNKDDLILRLIYRATSRRPINSTA